MRPCIYFWIWSAVIISILVRVVQIWSKIYYTMERLLTDLRNLKAKHIRPVIRIYEAMIFTIPTAIGVQKSSVRAVGLILRPVW